MTTEPKTPSIRPSLWACHRPIERYERMIAAAGAAAPGPCDLRISAIDAFLMYQFASFLPAPPHVVDLLADATAGSSTAFWLAHPAVPTVAIRSTEPCKPWRASFAQVCARLELEADRLSVNGDTCPAVPSPAGGPLLYLAGPASLGGGGSDGVSRILAARADAIVLYLSVGRVGQCREVESLISACQFGGPLELRLMRDVSPFFAESSLAVIRPAAEPTVIRVLERVAAMFEGNFQFLTLARSVVETAVAAAARPDASGNGAASAGRAGQRGTTYTELLEKVRRQVEQSTSVGAKAIVISKGDDRLLDLPGRLGWHFPQDETGSYAGHHPADSASAIAHLESLRGKGGQFLVVPATAMWWLEFYADFRRHLEANYPVLVCRPETCLIFDLRPRAERHEPPAVEIPYPQMVNDIRHLVARTIPQQATVLVVSKGDSQLLDLGGRRAWHFPRDQSGEYAGHHPADGRAAIEHLELLRARGADYLLLPAAYRWWLDHYADFARHLSSRYERVSDDARCIIFQLRRPFADRLLGGARRAWGRFRGVKGR